MVQCCCLSSNCFTVCVCNVDRTSVDSIPCPVSDCACVTHAASIDELPHFSRGAKKTNLTRIEWCVG